MDDTPHVSLPRTEDPALDPFAAFAGGEELLADTERAIADGVPPDGSAEAVRAQVILALVLSHVDRHRLHPSLEPTPPELALARALVVVLTRGSLLKTPQDWE